MKEKLLNAADDKQAKEPISLNKNPRVRERQNKQQWQVIDHNDDKSGHLWKELVYTWPPPSPRCPVTKLFGMWNWWNCREDVKCNFEVKKSGMIWNTMMNAPFSCTSPPWRLGSRWSGPTNQQCWQHKTRYNKLRTTQGKLYQNADRIRREIKIADKLVTTQDKIGESNYSLVYLRETP